MTDESLARQVERDVAQARATSIVVRVRARDTVSRCVEARIEMQHRRALIEAGRRPTHPAEPDATAVRIRSGGVPNPHDASRRPG
jgi:hypothetical protein